MLEEYNSPERLVRHLRIVTFTAINLVDALKKEWNLLSLNGDFVLFGAASHDIGKVIVTKELYKKGKKHELCGRNLLLEKGFSIELSRFAYTHGNWQNAEPKLEDLLVSLADKIWKGKREFELEEMIAHLISNQLQVDYWEIYQKLDIIIQNIGIHAEDMLNWQNEMDEL